MVIFSTHYSTMEHLTTDNYLKSIDSFREQLTPAVLSNI